MINKFQTVFKQNKKQKYDYILNKIQSLINTFIIKDQQILFAGSWYFSYYCNEVFHFQNENLLLSKGNTSECLFFYHLYTILLIFICFFTYLRLLYYLNLQQYSPKKLRMKAPLCALVLILALSTISLSATVIFDIGQTDKHGSPLKLQTCNEETVIDFWFDPSTVITACNSVSTPYSCTLTNPSVSWINFLDVSGLQQIYTLVGVSVYSIPSASYTLSNRMNEDGIFQFTFTNAATSKNLIAAVAFSSSIPATAQPYTYNMAGAIDSSLNTLNMLTTATITTGLGLALSAFNFLNVRDLGIFYEVADSTVTNTYLLSNWVLNNMVNLNPSAFPAYSTTNYFVPPTFAVANFQQTADKLCYGSQNIGIFQTHLRESYPLWTAWIGILFYWLSLLWADPNEMNNYDKNFQDNKWTCWSIYSLHFLGHEQYFTKQSRTTQMLISFSWQACVHSILYANVTFGQGPVMILWAAIIGWITTMPFTYILGHIFLRKIYELTLHKYEVMKKMKGLFNKKDGAEAYEKQIDNTQESLYGYYYWYYVIAFCIFISFFTIAVHEMQTIPRQYYYLMYYWLASFGVAFGLQHILFDPLLTLIFGNFDFYRNRGFYYDFRLGEGYKEVQE